MSFADDYREYQGWALTQNTSPEAWEEHKALLEAAERGNNPELGIALDLLSDVEAYILNDDSDAVFGEIIRSIWLTEFEARARLRKEVEPE